VAFHDVGVFGAAFGFGAALLKAVIVGDDPAFAIRFKMPINAVELTHILKPLDSRGSIYKVEAEACGLTLRANVHTVKSD
jgi:hypothetical protein